ncbi:MAG TPA: undecaprenyl-diphosphate phosphatase [Kineosporiaceae bacterium]|nr:undecaprenyl-diphosphate phosphatase [Kineosporiaceae bacterium]
MSLTYPEAIVVGALQGVSELFPVSSLGHAVLVPALVGGRWATDLSVSAPESPYLAFIVGLHVATALALLVFYWRDWVRIVAGLLDSVRHRRVTTPDARLGWLLLIATIPVGLTGLLLEHVFRTTLGRPVPAAAFLMVNGVILVAGERLRRREQAHAVPATVTAGRATSADVVGSAGPGQGDAAPAGDGDGSRPVDDALPVTGDDAAADARLAGLGVWDAFLVGASQSLALLPGISRSGVSMVAGLFRGLTHADAARFSFLLATPVILAAGVLKLPDLFGPLGEAVRGQVLAGSAAAFVAAYLSVRWLTRWFRTRTLVPFAIYCLVVGAVSLVVLSVR